MGKGTFIGNNQVVEFLKRAVRDQFFVHAYLFAGPSKIGKFSLAKDFAKSVLCQNINRTRANKFCGKCDGCLQFDKGLHADFHLLQKDDDKKNIPIEAIRSFQEKFYRTSLLTDRKVGIIDTADTLNIEGANALLKTLEEPPGKSIIILISDNLDSLPSTVISRCQVLPFTIVSRSEIVAMLEDIGCSRSTANTISPLSLGRPGIAVEFYKNSNKLERYTKAVRELIKIYDNSIAEKFSFIQHFLGSRKYQEKLEGATELLSQISIIIRDCVLIKSELEKQIVNISELSALKKLSLVFTYSDLISQQKKVQSIKDKLVNNINPQLALENYFLTMKAYA
ncbi:DNA polymerase III subunit [Patescibacteria group bacterium]|nr:DNA polymerase III subunit [Patescibacteria group bacterium]MBU1074811.1 DNA polymerase III subunit [Patescibacteria group bacterium]MBU1952414.1 DNA polymerase III subunit [Patescibacteria group bacterium]